MKYRKFGSTGIDISEIVFGAGAVGGVVFQTDRDTRIEAVRRGLEYGINWIDTAASYGDGQSEETRTCRLKCESAWSISEILLAKFSARWKPAYSVFSANV